MKLADILVKGNRLAFENDPLGLHGTPTTSSRFSVQLRPSVLAGLLAGAYEKYGVPSIALPSSSYILFIRKIKDMFPELVSEIRGEIDDKLFTGGDKPDTLEEYPEEKLASFGRFALYVSLSSLDKRIRDTAASFIYSGEAGTEGLLQASAAFVTRDHCADYGHGGCSASTIDKEVTLGSTPYVCADTGDAFGRGCWRKKSDLAAEAQRRAAGAT